MDLEVVKQDHPIANQMMLRYTINGRPTQDEIYSVTRTEVARMRSGAGGRSVIEPPIPVIKYPMTVGKSWKWAGTISMTSETGKTSVFNGVSDLTVAALESVKTNAGTLKTYRVDMNLTISSGTNSTSLSNSYWFAPGVGMVKQVAVIGGQTTEGIVTKYSIK